MSARARPNVLFILADDLGYGDLGHFGNAVVETPNLDALTRDGVTLTQHYSASPLCAPARAALLTGRYNHRTGAVDVASNRGLDRIDPSETTMADMFRGAGYATGMVGKWHNGLHDLRFHPNRRGFDAFLGFLNGGMDYWRWSVDRNGQTERSDGRYLTDVFSDEALRFVEAHAQEPFFLHLSYNAPHLPLQAPDELVSKYRGQGELTEEVATLYAMVEAMDRGIGRVLAALEAQGLAQDTIVVFASDNGPVLRGGFDRDNGPFRGAKGDAHEGGIRVPAIVRWPAGLPAGTHCEAMTHFCDWMPTLARMAGVAAPSTKPLDGTDIRERLRGRGAPAEERRFWQRNRYEPVARCNAAVREGPWKLLWPMRANAAAKDAEDTAFYRHGERGAAHWRMDIDLRLPERSIGAEPAPALFDVERDPAERFDRAAEQPERVARMTQAWDRWFENVERDREAAWRVTRRND
jgi:arylsulfatase A